jgi:hypothetical protein
MKKTIFLSAVIVILALLINGCKPAAAPTAPAAAGPTIYTAGAYSPDGIAFNPCYWQGTKRTDLDNDGYESEVYGMAVSGGTVYTAGYDNDGFENIPCYWTGQTKQTLPSESNEGNANAINVVGGTIYTAGYYVNGSDIGTACYWTGLNETDLNGGTIDACAFALDVFDGTVYTAGYYIYGTETVGCYWTGSTKTDLLGGTIDACALAISVVGASIYTAGYYFDVNAGYDLPCYWISAIFRYVLPTPNMGNGQANSIYVSGGTVYISGFYNNGTYDIPCYWTLAPSGATRTDLPGPADAWPIVVSGGTVYVGGYHGSYTNPTTPCYWAGTTETDLATYGDVYAIFVQ